MSKSPLIYLVLVALLFVACSDTSTSPDDGNNNGGNDKCDTCFAIASVDKDTVLWEDTVTVLLTNLTSDSVTLFIHTMSVGVDSLWRDNASNGGIRFRVPETASSGQIRIFQHGDIQAKGNHPLFVYPRHRSNVFPRVQSFSPKRVYAGDEIIIGGFDIPFAAHDMSVTVRGIELPILRWDSIRIFARVTEEVKTGPLTVRLLERFFQLDTLQILEHGARITLPGNKRSISIQAMRLAGTSRVTTIQGMDTLSQITPLTDLGTYCPFSSATTTETSDSIVCIADEVLDSLVRKFELRLKHEPDSRVSGILRVTNDEPYAGFKVRFTTEVEIRNMRWHSENGKYMLSSNGTEVSDVLVNYWHRVRTPTDIIEVIDYEGATSTSHFSIVLE